MDLVNFSGLMPCNIRMKCTDCSWILSISSDDLLILFWNCVYFVQEEMVKTVQSRVRVVLEVKNVTITEKTSRCRIALWHDVAHVAVNVGDYVEVTDVVTSEWDQEVYLSSTRKKYSKAKRGKGKSSKATNRKVHPPKKKKSTSSNSLSWTKKIKTEA